MSIDLIVYPDVFIRVGILIDRQFKENSEEFLEFVEKYQGIFSFLLANDDFRSEEVSIDSRLLKNCQYLFDMLYDDEKLSFFEVRSAPKKSIA